MKLPFSIALIFIFAFGILLYACSKVVGPEEELKAAPLIIRSGTSFGMCLGYCQTEIEITEQETIVALRSFRAKEQYPDKTCENATGQDEWQALQQSVNREAFLQLPDTIGCPDCADGGAEWLEIEEGDKKYRVTFEFNADIPQIEPLLSKVRQLRNEYAGRCR